MFLLSCPSGTILKRDLPTSFEYYPKLDFLLFLIFLFTLSGFYLFSWCSTLFLLNLLKFLFGLYWPLKLLFLLNPFLLNPEVRRAFEWPFLLIFAFFVLFFPEPFLYFIYFLPISLIVDINNILIITIIKTQHW